MNRKSITLIALLFGQQLHCYHSDGVGLGFATGTLFGTGVALAATSGARAPRDPYYDLERAKAQQELREMKEEHRLRRAEEREERRRKREEEREERRIKRDKERAKRSESSKKEEVRTTKESKQKHTKAKTAVSKKEHKSTTPSQTPEELELEIKKLELEIAQLKHKKHQKS